MICELDNTGTECRETREAPWKVLTHEAVGPWEAPEHQQGENGRPESETVLVSLKSKPLQPHATRHRVPHTVLGASRTFPVRVNIFFLSGFFNFICLNIF